MHPDALQEQMKRPRHKLLLCYMFLHVRMDINWYTYMPYVDFQHRQVPVFSLTLLLWRMVYINDLWPSLCKIKHTHKSSFYLVCWHVWVHQQQQPPTQFNTLTKCVAPLRHQCDLISCFSRSRGWRQRESVCPQLYMCVCLLLCYCVWKCLWVRLCCDRIHCWCWCKVEKNGFWQEIQWRFQLLNIQLRDLNVIFKWVMVVSHGTAGFFRAVERFNVCWLLGEKTELQSTMSRLSH